MSEETATELVTPKESSTSTIFEQPDPKYAHPKVLLIDVGTEAEHDLKKEGFNVSTGSFGTPYQVEKSDKYRPVITNGKLPFDFAEQEIVVIDLTPANTSSGLKGEKSVSEGELDLWAKPTSGIIDPRPRLMTSALKRFDEILAHGGSIIVFADQRVVLEMVLAKTGDLGGLKVEREFSVDNWSFLSILDSNHLTIPIDRGQEIRVAGNLPKFLEESSIGRILSKHSEGAHFCCTFTPSYAMKDNWIPLAVNKYNRTVACVIAKKQKGKPDGMVFILPQLNDRPLFLTKLLTDVLPALSPHLFPNIQKARWVERPEYELPRVSELKNRIQQIQEEAEKQLAECEHAITKERESQGYMHDLISATGQPVVSAVKKAFNTLGFHNVIDVDEELGRAGNLPVKREDLRILDHSPALLVEVKGISSLPGEDETLQVGKYVAPRMKEWDSTDIQGLAIINHQRNLPALERRNSDPDPFGLDAVTSAERQHLGLMTTWDLFRLVRSFVKNDWKQEYVKSLFYQHGRILPVPEHYKYLGRVEQFWPKVGALSIRIEESELKQGDRVAFELPVEFEEQVVESIQVDNETVSQAETGVIVGIKTHLTKERARKGVRVFRIAEPSL